VPGSAAGEGPSKTIHGVWDVGVKRHWDPLTRYLGICFGHFSARKTFLKKIPCPKNFKNFYNKTAHQKKTMNSRKQ
jgi:hypothetical protein